MSIALATSAVVELAKLWQARWLVAFRHTTIGHLLLGHVFSWQNLVAYGVGVLAGVTFEGLSSAMNQRRIATRHDVEPAVDALPDGPA